jgi:hypothetical protein
MHLQLRDPASQNGHLGLSARHYLPIQPLALLCALFPPLLITAHRLLATAPQCDARAHCALCIRWAIAAEHKAKSTKNSCPLPSKALSCVVLLAHKNTEISRPSNLKTKWAGASHFLPFRAPWVSVTLTDEVTDAWPDVRQSYAGVIEILNGGAGSPPE